MIDMKTMVTCFSRRAVRWSCINKIKKDKFELVIFFLYPVKPLSASQPHLMLSQRLLN